MNSRERYVLELCHGIIKEWLKEQPYRECINIKNTPLKTYAIGIPFRLKPALEGLN